jgi:hypothetical protein
MEQRKDPGRRRILLVGAAIAIPLAAVGLYFAFLAAPTPPSQPVGQAMSRPPAGGPGAGDLPPNHPPIGAPAAAPQGDRAHPQFGAAGRAVRVPDQVKGKWQAVRLRVEAKSGSTPAQTLTVTLGGEMPVPGSGLVVRAGEFLPALQVKDNEITSISNDPVNPAALVTILEGGKTIFQGWLFSKFPDMQPFEHPGFRVTLVDAVPAR